MYYPVPEISFKDGLWLTLTMYRLKYIQETFLNVIKRKKGQEHEEGVARAIPFHILDLIKPEENS